MVIRAIGGACSGVMDALSGARPFSEGSGLSRLARFRVGHLDSIKSLMEKTEIIPVFPSSCHPTAENSPSQKQADSQEHVLLKTKNRVDEHPSAVLLRCKLILFSFTRTCKLSA